MARETHSSRRSARVLCAAATLIVLAAPPARGARTASNPAAGATSLAAAATATSLQEMARTLGATARVAGTPEAARAAHWIGSQMRAWGLDVQMHEYDVWLPHAREVSVQRLGARSGAVANVAWDAGPDMRSELSNVLGSRVAAAAGWAPPEVPKPARPIAAGYSAAGEIVAPVVYANYGRREDFAALDQARVDLSGRIAMIRYGAIFRGDKVRNAEEAGAAAVILYSDPLDDGYARGAVYPEGPYRPPSAIQRGSVKVGPPGDPASYGRPAQVGSDRREPRKGLPAVPVVALSYEDAYALIADIQGAAAPAAWQGALPTTYRFGGHGPLVRVRVVLHESPWRRIRNVVGTIRGARRPDEWVILGAHYDSWTPGAIDNVSGTVAMLEAARLIAEQTAAGRPPERSLLFAAWDAEEWGLIGSTEWVEEHAQQLRDGAVAYINLDGVAGGPYFSAVASPSLRFLLREATNAVGDPVLPHTTVLGGWRGRLPEDEFGLPGGGSDYAAFASLAGIPSMGFGFSAASGVYHSDNDTIEYMERFGDPGYRQHRAAASMAAWLMWRLGNDALAGFDYRPLAEDVVTGLSAVRTRLARMGHRNGVPGLTEAWSGAGAFAEAAGLLAAKLREPDTTSRSTDTFDRTNELLLRVHRSLMRIPEAGVWSRNIVVAPDPEDTYRSLFLPGVVHALRRGDAVRAGIELSDLATALHAAAAELRRARAALETPRRRGMVAGR